MDGIQASKQQEEHKNSKLIKHGFWEVFLINPSSSRVLFTPVYSVANRSLENSTKI